MRTAQHRAAIQPRVAPHSTAQSRATRSGFTQSPTVSSPEATRHGNDGHGVGATKDAPNADEESEVTPADGATGDTGSDNPADTA